MRITVLIITGMLLSNCAAVKMITGHSIQAQDVISGINTINNLQKYSEPAAREELDREVRAWLKQQENQ
jgi:hypothetical protein